jgi:hypothetical protein
LLKVALNTKKTKPTIYKWPYFDHLVIYVFINKEHWVWFMVFNGTFNNISVISWRLVLLVEETRVPGENHWPAASHWQTLLHNIVSSEWDLNLQY